MDKAVSKDIKDKLGKLTMKEPYSKTRFFPKRIRAAIDLFRPFTLAAPFIVSMSIMAASLVYSRSNVPSDWWVTIGQASLTIAIVNAASNSLNQATDLKADKISKPYRPIPAGLIRPDEAQSIAYIFYLFALLRAITINVWFGFFIFMIMVFTVMYSLPPRMKKYLFINQVWIAIPRGMLGILASWSVFGNPFDTTPIIIGSIATIFLIGGMSTKDIVDSVADKMTGTRTLINTFGTKKTALISFPFMLLPFTTIPFFVDIGMLDSYLWPLSFAMLLSIIVFYFMLREEESETLENVHAWSLMYVEYIFFSMGFAVLTIFGGIGEIKIIF